MLTHGAQRCCSETEQIILEDFSSSVWSPFQKYHTPGNLEFNYLGIFQSLKLRISMGKILLISLKLNFTPNTLDWYRVMQGRLGKKPTHAL